MARFQLYAPDGTIANKLAQIADHARTAAPQDLDAIGLALLDKSPAVRTAALDALTALDALDRPICLLTALSSHSPALRCSTARILATRLAPDPTAPAPVRRALDALPVADAVAHLIAAMQDDKAKVKHEAIAAAEALIDASDDPDRDRWRRVLDAFRRLSGHVSRDASLEVSVALGEAGSAVALPTLWRFQQSKRQVPALPWILWRIGGRTAADLAVDDALSRPRASPYAARLLRAHGRRSHADKLLRAIAADDHASAAAARLLGDWGVADAIPILVRRIAEDRTHQQTGEAFVDALHTLDPPDVAGPLTRALGHRSPWIRLPAARALAVRGFDAAPLLDLADRTLAAVASPLDTFSHPIASAVGIVAALPGPRAARILIARARRTGGGWTRVSRAWSADPSPAATDALRAIATDGEGPPQLRVAAIWALAPRTPPPFDPLALETIARTLERNEHILQLGPDQTKNGGPIEPHDLPWFASLLAPLAQHLLATAQSDPAPVRLLAPWIVRMHDRADSLQRTLLNAHKTRPDHITTAHTAAAREALEAWSVLADWAAEAP